MRPSRGSGRSPGRSSQPARSTAAPRSGRSRVRRVWVATYRTVIALLSTMVLVATAYAWVNFNELKQGLSRNDLTGEAGGDGSIDILLVGMDSRTDAQGHPLPAEVLSRLRAGKNEANLTDTLMLLHIPNNRSRAVAYSFPRDAYVTIPGDHGTHKINSAFGRGKAEAAERARGVADVAERERRSSAAGRKLMLRTVERLSGVSIDHYAEVNLLGFYELTQAVGGVPVCLKESTSDPYSGAYFPAGHQVISGSDALAFVRQRHGLPRGDLDRVVRQQAFLAGLAKSMLSGGGLSPSKVSELIQSLQRSIVLDRDWDLLAFAERMRSFADGAVTFRTIPIVDSAYETPDGLAVKVDPSQVRHAIRGDAPGRISQPRGRDARVTALSGVTVNVRNRTDDTGLAARVLRVLAHDHVPVGGATDGTDRRATSLVEYAPGEADAAELVARELGGLPVESSDTLRDGQVRVLLGSDYRGPGFVGFAPRRLVSLDGVQRQPDTNPAPGITTSGVPCVN